MIPLKRVLTYKSKLGFGKWKDYTVQELFNLNKKDILISPYFRLSSITYTEEILIELGITNEFRIEKPSIDKDMHFKFISETTGFKVRSKEKMKPYRTKLLSNGILQYLNHK
jgi:hypothetical protein